MKMQFQDQGVPLTRNEGSNQPLDNNSNLLKHQPNHSLTLKVRIQGNGFKVAQLYDKCGMASVNMLRQQVSFVGNQMDIEQENSQGHDYKNVVLER